MEKPIIEKAIRGTLKFLVFNRFYGFITRFDTREDIFVHGSEIRYINPMQFTRRCGDSVIFDLAVGVKGLEAVNVILNLAEQEGAEEELCDESTDGKDSMYEFAKPGLVIMKKKSGLDDESVIGSEIDSTYTYTGDTFSLNTYPSLSSLSKYPSLSSLSSISCDGSLVSNGMYEGIGNQSAMDANGVDVKLPREVDIGSTEGNGHTAGTVEKVTPTASGNIDLEKLHIESDVGGTWENNENTDGHIVMPIADRTNRNEAKKDDGKKMTLAEFRGKSFRKIHEENMKRRTQVLL